MLGVTSYFDVKTRMVPDIIWLIFGGLGVILYVFDWNTVTSYHILSMIVTGAIALLLYLYRWTGAADVFAILSIAVILPVYYGFVMVSVVVLIGGFVIAGLVTLVRYVLSGIRHKTQLKVGPPPLMVYMLVITLILCVNIP